ncbi:MAG TPA: FliH/SctL family protein [Terriglobia bacterium]|nr:FliH/SctL family protein [Terriglobia bacterium]
MSSFQAGGSAAAWASDTKPFVYRSVPAVQPTGAATGSNDAKGKGDTPAQRVWGNSPQPEKPQPKYTEEELQTQLQAQVQVQLQAQLETQKKQAREQGVRECETRLRAEHDAALANERTRVTEALEEFVRERKSYFERAESEVVQLALAIARKILHREAQIDPLFLTGIVRVALEKVATTSSVKLRVSENDVFKWRQIVGALKGVQPQPEVVGDPTLPNGRCIMETDVGSTQISLDTQFREVERGLLDLLALRPAS